MLGRQWGLLLILACEGFLYIGQSVNALQLSKHVALPRASAQVAIALTIDAGVLLQRCFTGLYGAALTGITASLLVYLAHVRAQGIYGNAAVDQVLRSVALYFLVRNGVAFVCIISAAREHYY